MSRAGRLLMAEVILAIHSGDLPLHLAVQMTPEAMASGWAALDLDTQRDLLESLKHLGLVQIALAAAARTAASLDSPDFAIAIADASLLLEHNEPIFGRRLVQAIAEAQAEERMWHGWEGRLRARRLVVISRTLQAVQAYTDDVLSRVVFSRVAPYANQAIRHALEDRSNDELDLPAMIRALGPPTLEQVLVAVQAKAELLAVVP